MASKKITVNTQQVSKRANDLKEKNATLNKRISSLETLEGSLNVMWDGEANDTFHKEFCSDIVQMKNFHRLINEYVDKLNEIVRAYEQAERDVNEIAKVRTYK